jgi:hypothetical protein
VIIAWLLATIGFAMFLLYPDRLGRVVGLVMFGVGVVTFWTELFF